MVHFQAGNRKISLFCSDFTAHALAGSTTDSEGCCMGMCGVWAVWLYGVLAVWDCMAYKGGGTMIAGCMAVWEGPWPVRPTWKSTPWAQGAVKLQWYGARMHSMVCWHARVVRITPLPRFPRRPDWPRPLPYSHTSNYHRPAALVGHTAHTAPYSPYTIQSYSPYTIHPHTTSLR